MAIENIDGLYSVERPDAKSSALCVPQDNLDDLDFFPNFSGDFISLADILSTPEHKTILSVDEFILTAAQEEQEKKRKTGIEEGLNKMANPTAKRSRRNNNNDNNCGGWRKKKCSHCEAEETPLWRMGPMGPKTLCNACGMRYRSGRLVPEYRPAASPSFDSSKHSNYHRKIMQRIKVE